jgi:hypothetical protein
MDNYKGFERSVSGLTAVLTRILNKDKLFCYLSSVSIGPINNFKYEPVTSKEMKHY